MIKKTIISLIIFTCLSLSQAYAAAGAPPIITVEVTEKIPWANCTVKKAKDWTDIVWKWECKVKSGFWSVMDMIWAIIRYFTYLVWLWAVLRIIINGISYSISWVWWWKENAKKAITQTLLWIILLLLSWVILNMVAPWIYTWG